MNYPSHRFKSLEIVDWISPVGTATRLFANAISLQAFRNLRRDHLRQFCTWMGFQSFHVVSLSAVVVAIALTLQCVIELKKYQAQDLAGAVISLGLLREIGPLTISVAWCAMVSARLAEEAKRYYPQYQSDRSFAQSFILPRYICALTMALPLSAYGLVFGFLTGALFAPLLGVNSTSDFLESARQTIHNKDLWVYFLKLLIVNPTVGTFAGCIAGMNGRNSYVAGNAVSATFLTCFVMNLVVTIGAYVQGES